MKCGLLTLIRLGLFLFAFAFVISAQTAGVAEVDLSLADGKTIYRNGEPVRLILSFTASGKGYTLNSHGEKPTSVFDEVTVSPERGILEWAKQYWRAVYSMEDVIDSRELSETPTKLELVLNDFVRFDRAGKYSVRVKTRRVSGGNFMSGTLVPLTTNEVSFEIKEMSEADEDLEVKRISALLDAKRDSQSEWRAAAELSYLAGDASTREKIKRFLAPQGQSGNYFQQIWLGLFIARNRSLIIKSLETALRDINREPNSQLLNLLAVLRVLIEDEKKAAKSEIGNDSEAKQKRTDEAKQNYLRELLESLPRRAVKNRIATAITILDNLPRENPSPETISKLREILLKEFDSLNVYEQERLLGAYWNKFRDLSLVPSLEKILSKNDSQQLYGGFRSTVIDRLIELDEAKARPFVIAEIRNPNSIVNPDVLVKLTDEFLPETDEALLEQIREFGQLKTKNRDYVFLRLKALLAARYATANIYNGLMETYRNYAGQWFGDAKGSLLGYFARHNDKEAATLIEQALAKMGNGSESSFLGDLTKLNYTPGINELLQRRLNSDDPQAAGTAAYLMSKYGNEENKRLIEERLDRWLQQWKARAAELEASDRDDKLVIQKMLQVNLIWALMNAKAWKLTSAETDRLMQSCLSERCRQDFRGR